MFADILPSAAEALHPDWPEARFNLSGMFTAHAMVLELLTTMEEAFGCRLPVEAIHGAPAVLWNAGRPVQRVFNPTEFANTLNALHARGIGCFPTFTNHLLDSNDLNDSLCNQILDRIAQRPDLNGVIVASDRLSEYIARKYPALRQVASIVKVTFEGGEGRPDYYRELGERFYRYVVHPDDCRKLSVLEQLDREKAEIILNENCAIHCPNRPRHYDLYARWQKASSSEKAAVSFDSFGQHDPQQALQQEINQVTSRCQAPLDMECLLKGKRSCNLGRDEIKAIYEMGFRHFKLQGRADKPMFYAFDLTRFLLEPNLVGPLVLKKMLVGIYAAQEASGLL